MKLYFLIALITISIGIQAQNHEFHDPLDRLDGKWKVVLDYTKDNETTQYIFYSEGKKMSVGSGMNWVQYDSISNGKFLEPFAIDNFIFHRPTNKIYATNSNYGGKISINEGAVDSLGNLNIKSYSVGGEDGDYAMFYWEFISSNKVIIKMTVYKSGNKIDTTGEYILSKMDIP